MYYIFQEMFIREVLFFLLVTNGKSRWHSGDFLLFLLLKAVGTVAPFCWGKPHSNIKNIKIWTIEIEKVLKNEK